MQIDEQYSESRVEIGFLEALKVRLPENTDVLKALGDLYTEVGMITEGLAIDLDLAERCPKDPNVWYNLACSYALDQQVDSAFEALHTAVDHGYCDKEWLSSDSDLEMLHADARYAELLKRIC